MIQSCASSVNNEFEDRTVHINVNLGKESRTVKMSEFVEDVQFVPVTCDGEFTPVGPIARYSRGFFYVVDCGSERIFKIREDGTVVSRIGSQGRAANEYLGIYSFDVNPVTSEVYVYDIKTDRILIYAGEGEFVRSIDLFKGMHGLFRDFVVLPTGNIIGCCYDLGGASDLHGRGVWMVDSDGKFVKQIVSIDEHNLFEVGISLPLFSKIGEDTVCIMGPVGDDAIYKIDTAGNVVTRYLFDFGSQIRKKDLHRESSIPLPGYFFFKTGFCASFCDFNVAGIKGENGFFIKYIVANGECLVLPDTSNPWVQDVPNYRVGAATDGSCYLNFCDAEHLPSDIPNPDSVELWMVVEHLKKTVQ